MMTRTAEPNHFEQQAQLIKDQVATVLAKWGLLSRFSRWRLTQDPDTGMVVLFGVLNSKYIATHTSIPFSDYFDPHLLHDMANELQVQVVSCNGDGLRYAFVLDRGQLEKLPTHIDFPFVEQGKLFVRVVYNDILQPSLPLAVNAPIMEDLAFLRQMTAAFLKVFDDIKIQDDAALLLAAQNPPAIVFIDRDEFNKRVAEHEVNRQRVKRIGRLFENDTG